MKLEMILTTWLFLTCNAISAQTYKIFYDFKWRQELGSENYNSELTVLQQDKDVSYYESVAKFKYDSIKTIIANDGGRSFPAPKTEWKLQTLVVKDTKEQITTTEEIFFDKVYLTKYLCKPVWKITEDRHKIFNYNVQKAETDFAGRHWIAWFTMDIPIGDGPYKFYGLPGLILKVSDSEEHFIFEIKGLVKERNSIEGRNAHTSKVSLSPGKREIFWNNYREDPSMIFANLNAPGATFSYVYQGLNVDSREAKALYNKREKEKINTFRIPIETCACDF